VGHNNAAQHCFLHAVSKCVTAESTHYEQRSQVKKMYVHDPRNSQAFWFIVCIFFSTPSILVYVAAADGSVKMRRNVVLGFSTTGHFQIDSDGYGPNTSGHWRCPKSSLVVFNVESHKSWPPSLSLHNWWWYAVDVQLISEYHARH
jgi:hypothetical protein